jgi:prolyl 4-hydroxylase
MSGSTALKIFGFLVPAVAILLGLAQTGLWPSGWLRNGLNGHAEGSGPKAYVLSDDPVVVYVKDFISTEEAAHLVALA